LSNRNIEYGTRRYLENSYLGVTDEANTVAHEDVEGLVLDG